jgi:pilus assembly protein CpaC
MFAKSKPSRVVGIGALRWLGAAITVAPILLIPIAGQAQLFKLDIPVPDIGRPDSGPAPMVRVPSKRPVHRNTPPADPAAPPRAKVARQHVTFESGSGQLVDLSAPAANVFVADPKIADVRPGSATSLFVFGLAPGRTTVAALDDDGHAVAEFDVTVKASSFNANAAEAAVNALLPGKGLRVTSQPKGLLVSGSLNSPQDAARAMAIVRSFVTDGQTVDDQIGVTQQSVQVQLRVRIAEMSRSVTRGLGVNWQSIGKLGGVLLKSPILQGVDVAYGRATVGSGDINALVDALATDNLARILAEPNLVAMSGQTASFLAGGEFPIPVSVAPAASGTGGSISVEYKKYGVQLSFQPTVLTDGRINLKVAPEVSQLSSTGSVTTSAITIPALVTRRAETTVELGSGESFAIAGLLQQSSTQNDAGLPQLGDVPVLGALFRSDRYQRNETELVIIVTPYVVQPTSKPDALHVPGEDYRPPSDLERILALRQVGVKGTKFTGQIPGSAGFVLQ